MIEQWKVASVNTIRREDPVWQQAVDWVIREHEKTLGATERKSLLIWLAEAAEHRNAYTEARKIWLLTGLVPAEDEQG